MVDGERENLKTCIPGYEKQEIVLDYTAGSRFPQPDKMMRLSFHASISHSSLLPGHVNILLVVWSCDFITLTLCILYLPSSLLPLRRPSVFHSCCAALL